MEMVTASRDNLLREYPRLCNRLSDMASLVCETVDEWQIESRMSHVLLDRSNHGDALNETVVVPSVTVRSNGHYVTFGPCGDRPNALTNALHGKVCIETNALDVPPGELWMVSRPSDPDSWHMVLAMYGWSSGLRPSLTEKVLTSLLRGILG